MRCAAAARWISLLPSDVRARDGAWLSSLLRQRQWTVCLPRTASNAVGSVLYVCSTTLLYGLRICGYMDVCMFGCLDVWMSGYRDIWTERRAAQCK